MMWHATRAFHPSKLPAPHGRGPQEWPLVVCAKCRTPLAWPEREGRPIGPRSYYEQGSPFCSRECRRAWIGVPPPRRQSPVNFSDPPIPNDRPRAFAWRLPQASDITACAHCHAGPGALRWVGVGFSCRVCGHVMHAADGDWERESRTPAHKAMAT